MAEGGFQAIIGELGRVPGMIDQVRTGITALRAIADVPSAASSTGHPLMSAAIVGLGAEMIVFVLQAAEALQQDIEGLTGTREGYERNEESLSADAQQGLNAVCGLMPGDNRIGGPEVSTYTTGVLTAVGRTDDYANAAARWYGNSSDQAQRGLNEFGATVRTGGNQLARSLDGSWPTGAAIVRGGTAMTQSAINGTVGGLEAGEGTVDRGAHAAGTLGRRADRMLEVDTSPQREAVR